jgi:AhpD family alkylhydroperoxidase
MSATMKSPVFTLPAAMEALQAFSAAAAQTDLPQSTVDLVHLRVSQINGCAVCLDMHVRGAKKAGETDQRLSTVAAWRETPYFTEAERAALALAEATTRMADRAEPVPAELREEAAKHFSEEALAALIIQIAAINTWNRINVASGQVTGEWIGQWTE